VLVLATSCTTLGFELVGTVCQTYIGESAYRVKTVPGAKMHCEQCSAIPPGGAVLAGVGGADGRLAGATEPTAVAGVVVVRVGGRAPTGASVGAVVAAAGGAVTTAGVAGVALAPDPDRTKLMAVDRDAGAARCRWLTSMAAVDEPAPDMTKADAIAASPASP
jgi:hypothetical protein